MAAVIRQQRIAEKPQEFLAALDGGRHDTLSHPEILPRILDGQIVPRRWKGCPGMPQHSGESERNR